MDKHTWISDLDSDLSSLERLSVQGQGGLQTLKVLKLSVGKSLGTVLLAVLDDADIDDLAVGEEFGDGLGGGVV